MNDRIEALRLDRHHGAALLLLALLALLLLALFLRAELALTGGVLGVPLDDAWIHYQFARNLSQGHGFSYNPGEPTPGSTAPLWTLLLGGVGLFVDDFLLPSLLLSGALLLLTACLSYGLAYSLSGRRGPALLAGAGVLLSGRLLWVGLAGMETTAFTACSLAAIWLYQRQGLRAGPALLFALASQLRPEGHALFALALLAGVWSWGRRQQAAGSSVAGAARAFVATFLLPGLVYLAVSLPYVLFSLGTTGHPLPNTFYAKVGSEHFFSWRTLSETAAYHFADNPLAFLLLPLGLPLLWRRNRLIPLWLLGLPLFTAVIVDATWHHGRYTMPLIPLQIVAGSVALAWLWQRGGAGRRRLLVAALSLLFLAGGAWQLPRWATMLGTNAREILEIDVALGNWLAENTPPQALLAVDDIGAITYLSQRRIVDLNGLVSPELWPAVRQPVGRPRDQVATRILSELRPDYLVAFPLWHWELTQNPQVSRPVHRVETATHTIIFQPEAAVYETEWPYLAPLPAGSTPHDALFADAIRLEAFARDAPAAGDVPLTLYWRSLASVAADYDVFVHLLDGAGQIVVQADRQPVHGLAPTSLWQTGDLIRDRYTLPLPAPLAPGTYEIRVGFFDRESGARLPVTAGEAAADAALLTRFTIAPE